MTQYGWPKTGRPPDGVTRIRCLIYVRISMDKTHDGHGVANQMAKLEQKAAERGWTVVYRLSDNDIGVTRKDPTKPGKYRPGYEEAMRLVDARMVDAVLCFKWDRFIREPLDLEYLIPRFDKAGVRFAEVDGSIDLGTDSGRLHARIMIAVAKAEQERKAERQKLAFEQAAINGKRFTGCPRPFGYLDDHVTAHPVEGPAVAEACVALLGGGTISGIRREWTRLGLNPPQQTQRGTTTWNRTSIRMILLNPRIAGLSVYRGEIVGQGEWQPLVPEETWRAVRGILEDPPASRRAGCGRCWAGWRCARAGTWSPACHLTPGITSTGAPRHPQPGLPRRACGAASRAGGEFHGETRGGQAVPAGCRRSGECRGGRLDVAGLREEAAAIRRNLEEMAGDWALGRISRPQMLKATQAGNGRLEGSAPSWTAQRGRTCWPRWSRPRTLPPCGRGWTSAASAR